MPRHFLTGAELSAAELAALIDRAAALKAQPLSCAALTGRTVALIFQAPSTRTRVSFEAGVFELGGHPMVLRPDELQISRGESLRDTALVLSRHVAAIGIRTGPDAIIEELAAHATVPVFNMLTAGHHPVQALADLLTLKEAFGGLDGPHAGLRRGRQQRRPLAGDRRGEGRRRGADRGARRLPARAGGGRAAHRRSARGRAGADAVYTDVWVSMSDDPETAEQRRRDLAAYRIDDALLAAAAPGAIALHCLPAHPGEEITAEVLYGERQRIWDQAENRRHAQKALLELLAG